MADEVLTVAEVAGLLKRHQQTVRNWFPLRTAETGPRDTGGDDSAELELADGEIRLGGVRGAIAFRARCRSLSNGSADPASRRRRTAASLSTDMGGQRDD